MLRHLSPLLACLFAAPAAIATEAVPAGLGWQASFTENALLPPMFRQLDLARPDGSKATVFLGDFDNSLAERKPLLIYLEGSGAMSQFTRMGNMIGYGIYGLIAQETGARYHVATIEKRGVPFGWSVERPGSAIGASEEYLRHATLEDRVADVRLALDALLVEPRIDRSRVVLIGHSEGADIAAVVAGRDERVTHVACLAGGGAPQFFDFFVGRRNQMRASGASEEAIVAALAEMETQIREILARPDSIEEFWLGHPYRRWASFATRGAADALATTSAGVFVAHGSADQAVPVESFDYLVSKLLISGNPNVVIRRYPGRDHGFGSAQTEPGSGLIEVIEAVLEWAES